MSLSKYSIPSVSGYFPISVPSTYFPECLTQEVGLRHGENHDLDILSPPDSTLATPKQMYNAFYLEDRMYHTFACCDDDSHLGAEMNLRSVISQDTQLAAALFRGQKIDTMYHDLQPCVQLQREAGPLVMMRPVSSTFGNRRFICNLDSKIYRFLRRYCFSNDIYFVNRVYRQPQAQFLDLFPINFSENLMEKLNSTLENTLRTAGKALSGFADLHSIVMSVLSVIECCMHPSIISLTLVITSLLRSFSISASVITHALAALKPHLTSLTYTQPIGQMVEGRVERSMCVVLVGLVATIATGSFPAQKIIDAGLSRINLTGRAISGANIIADMFSSQLDHIIDYVYETIYGVPRAVSQLEKFLSGIEKYIKDIREFDKDDVCSRVTSDPSCAEEMKALYSRGNDYLADLLRMKTGPAVMASFMNFFKIVREAYDAWKIAGGDGLAPRAEPPFFLFHGAPGVGKSNLFFQFARDLLRLEGLSLNRETYANLVYHRNVEQDFWDGYRNQYVCLYDDMLQLKDTQAVPNRELMEVISSQNAIPNPLHMADIASKATTRFQSKIIIGTTNTLEYDIKSLCEPEAFHRRILCAWNVTIRPEYATPAGRIDPNKVSELCHSNFSTEVYVFRRMHRHFDPQTKEYGYVPTYISTPLGPMEVQLSYDQMFEESQNEYNQFTTRALSRLEMLSSDNTHQSTPIPLRVNLVAPYVSGRSDPSLTSRRPRRAVRQSSLSIKEQSLIAWWRYGSKPGEWFDFDMSEDIFFKLGQALPEHADAMSYCAAMMTLDFKVKLTCSVDFAEEYCENPSTWNVKEERSSKFAKVSSFISSLGDSLKIRAREALALFNTSKFGMFALIGGVLGLALWWRKSSPAGRMVTDSEFVAATSEITSGDSVTAQRPKAKFEITSGDSITAQRPKAKFEFTDELGNNKPKSQSLRDSNAYEVMSGSIWPNIYKIFACDYDGKCVKKLSNAVFLQGRCLMMNRHAYDLLMQQPRMRLVRQGMVKTLMTWTSELTNISPVRDREGNETDLVLVSLPRSIAAHRDITSHFISRRDQGDFVKSPASLVGVRNAHGENVNLWELSLVKAEAHDSENFDIDDMKGGLKPVNIRRNYQYSGNTVNGDCGSLLVLQNPQQPKKICGVHCAAFPYGAGISVAVCSEDIQNALKRFPLQVQCAPQFAPTTDLEVSVTDASLPKGEFIPVGKSEVKVVGALKSKILPSPIFGLVRETITAPARLRPFMKDGEEIDPLKMGLSKCGTAPVLIESNLIKAALANYAPIISAKTDNKYRKVFDLDVAIQGIPGDEFVPPLKRSTSAGFGWVELAKGKPGKTRWLGNDEYDLTHPALLKSVNNRIEQAKLGKRIPTYWTDTLKDERRSHEKVALGKTRVFSCGQMDFLIVMRQYFLGFNAHVMQNRISNEIAVGSNVYSADWLAIRSHVQRKGDRIVAGDFSTFDGTLNPQILWSILDLINNWYDDGDENRLIRSILWEDIVNSVHIHRDCVYQWTHSQPSGNPMTAVLNSIYNALSMRIVWQLVMKDTRHASLVEYSKHVSMISYGDDNLVNISTEVIALFNQNTITEGYALIGMIYTDENKNVDVLPSRTINEVSFLKRTFPVIRGQCLAPLALDTILEMISWVKGADDKETSCSVIVNSALRELSLHSEHVFDHWSTLIVKACLDANLDPPILSSHRDMQLSVLV